MAKDIKEQKEQAVILERLNNLISTNKEEHSQILEQVKKTNGSVCSHEKEIKKLNKYKDYLSGALVIVNLFVVPVLIWLVYAHLNGK